MNLPTLTGATGLLLDGAELDRQSIIDQLGAAIAKMAPNADVCAEMTALFHAVALRQTKASWWMAHYADRDIVREVVYLFTAEDKERHTAIRNRAAA